MARNDIAAQGEFRTKTAILDIYDRIGDAVKAGETYRTLLDPAPPESRKAKDRPE